jgi:hypothetical protein
MAAKLTNGDFALKLQNFQYMSKQTIKKQLITHVTATSYCDNPDQKINITAKVGGTTAHRLFTAANQDSG